MTLRPSPAGADTAPAPVVGQMTAADPWWSGGLLALLLVAAALLRFANLGTELWHDEIDMLARYIRQPLGYIVTTYDSQNNHPLYTLLARIAYVAAGGAEWAIRIPAVVFGVGSLWVAHRFARRVTSRAESFLLVLLLAVSYHHVWFSQNARGYTAMLCFTIVATALLFRIVEGEASRPWRLALAYGAVMALAAYTHLTAALVAAGHAVAVLASLAWRRDRRVADVLRWPGVALVSSALLTLLLYAPVLPQVVRVVLAPTMGGVEVEWTSGRWLIAEMLRVLSTGVPGGLASVAAAAAVLAIGVASYWRQSRLLALLCLCPMLVTAVTLLAMRHNLWPRFFFFGAAFFVMFALRGGFAVVRAVVPRAAGGIAIGGAVAVAALSALTVPRAWQPKQQLYAAAAFVQAERAAGDGVVALDLAADAYRLHRTPPGWRLTNSLEELTAVERASTRTWVVYAFPIRLRAAFPELAAHVAQSSYREVRVFPATVGGAEIRVLLLDSRPMHD